MWSRSGKILSAKTARLKTNVTSTTMFVAENAEVVRKHYEQIVETVDNPVPLYLPEAGKQASAATLDVGQDLF
jgi:demethoxyubiquinone hydroxylase (CLK1/Coq7/Cat5 family)